MQQDRNMIDVTKKFHECWTYFMVRYDENFDMKDFCQKLDLDYEHQKRYGTDEYMEIGSNYFYQQDVNQMVRQTLKNLFGKEDVLLELKEKYNLQYSLERVPTINTRSQEPMPKLSLDNDVVEFLCKIGAKDDLDYFIF